MEIIRSQNKYQILMQEISFLEKKWVLLNSDSDKPILDRLLENRGLTTEKEVDAFLNPSFDKMHDPFMMDDMRKSVDRIKKAVENKERIMIYGDYDVDGVTGTAIMVLVLQEIGAEVSYRLPNRQGDGYGLNAKVINEMHEVDTKLLITVDCGISCIEEVELAREVDMDVIITDHHTIPAEIPKSFAILHPKMPNCGYPYTELTGAGVALKLAQALIIEYFDKDEQVEVFGKYADLATLGTIADLGPLTGENRIIVSEGLENMHTSHWDGLRHLLEVCGIGENEVIHTNHIGFRIAPRINAAGRLESAYYALKLFLCDGEESKLFAERLEKINKERQRLTEVILNEADEIIKEQLKKEKILIAYHPSWHSGLVGIIAGKLSSKHGRPVIIMEERNDTYIGSSRGPAYYNLVDALGNSSKYLESFGGHVQAAGFTLKKENKDLFIESVQSQARDFLSSQDQIPEVRIDAEIEGTDLDLNLVEKVNLIRPYGMKNERPTFMLKGVTIFNLRRVGHDKNHLLGKIRVGQQEFKFIAFSMGDRIHDINNFTRADIVCHVDKNTYHKNPTVELQLLDLKLI
jgi:single-stranded-DNA-specific exonuclease